MLFTEFSFIFIFLPIALAVYHAARSARGAVLAAVVASIVFYAMWNVWFVPLLAFSTGATYLIARRLEVNRAGFSGGRFI